MKLLLGILIGLLGVTFGLAIAFFSPENTLVINESVGVSDSITASVIYGT